MERCGIAGSGLFVIDHVKMVNTWPEQGMLSIILEERRANGGCAYNVLKDLALLKSDIPLTAIGLVGDDEDGRYILNDLNSLNINTEMMNVLKNVSTPYTDVITVKETGVRTFFFNKGTCAHLDIEHFNFSKIRSKIFHIGYLLILDKLDSKDPEYGTRMARLLNLARKSGIKTSIDLVSEHSGRFKEIVPPALKYTDYLIINEIEAGNTTGFQIRMKDGSFNSDNLKRAFERLSEISDSELICIHFPEGAYAGYKDSAPLFMPSHKLPREFIKGTVGAGDAYCAGMLYGIHEEWDLERSMRFSGAMAAICLSDPTTSGGMKTLEETLKFMNDVPLREPVKGL